MQRQRLPKCRDGLRGSATVSQGDAQIVVGFGDVWPEADGPPDQIHGQIIPPQAMDDHAQKMQRIKMVRLPGQNVSVQPFRIGQTAGLVMLQRQFLNLLDRKFGHGRDNFTAVGPWGVVGWARTGKELRAIRLFRLFNSLKHNHVA